MSDLHQILIAFGGPSVLLVVLAFLARSLLQTWLAKDIKRFESDLRNTADNELERLKQELKSKGDASIEQLKSVLQQAAIEHQVRFSNLHEKRAEIIAYIYKRLVETFSDSQRFVFQMGHQEKQAEYLATQKRILDFYDFVEIHRIYLPEHICESLSRFIGALRKPVVEVYVYGDIDYPNEQTLKERKEAFMKAYESFQNDIPKARKLLQDEFRAILGVDGSHPPPIPRT